MAGLQKYESSQRVSRASSVVSTGPGLISTGARLSRAFLILLTTASGFGTRAPSLPPSGEATILLQAPCGSNRAFPSGGRDRITGIIGPTENGTTLPCPPCIRLHGGGADCETTLADSSLRVSPPFASSRPRMEK